MFLAKADLEYGWKKKLIELMSTDLDAYLALRGKVKLYKLPLTQEELEKLSEWQDKTDFVDGAEVEAWNSVGIDVKLSRMKGVASNSRDLRQTVYQISVANVGLIQIQRVDVLEDCCTDELQRWLDRGWRLLAVCPPNDARRPSYVMGHFEKEA